MNEHSIPNLVVKIDPITGTGVCTTNVTPKRKIKFNVTGNLIKEFKKHKFNVKSDCSYQYTNQSGMEPERTIFDNLSNYKNVLPLSEKLYFWLLSRSKKSKMFTKLLMMYSRKQYVKDFEERKTQSEKCIELDKVGKCVIYDETTNSMIPIKLDEKGFTLPDGYYVEKVKDGIDVNLDK